MRYPFILRSVLWTKGTLCYPLARAGHALTYSPGVRVNEQGEHGEDHGQGQLHHGDDAMTPAQDDLLHEHPVEMGPLQLPPRHLDVVVVES